MKPGREQVSGAERELSLGGVQKTLLLPLWGRAIETERPKPLLVDRSATELVGQLHFDFAPISESIPAIVRLSWIARALHVDRAVKAYLADRPQATVLNLGCGLDTTFQRVDNGSLQWINLDLPEVIALRRDLLPSGPRQRSIATSVLDPGWIDEIDASDGVFVVAAGLLCYFEEQLVRDLLVRMTRALPGGGMVLDTFSPLGMRASNRRVLHDSGMDSTTGLRGRPARSGAARRHEVVHRNASRRSAGASGGDLRPQLVLGHDVLALGELDRPGPVPGRRSARDRRSRRTRPGRRR
jgi:O-methyltransferase involved in polyketide biosynthesis